MSLNSSLEPDKTDETVSCASIGTIRSTWPSGPRTDIDRSGVSNVPGANSVTFRLWRVVSVPSPLDTV